PSLIRALGNVHAETRAGAARALGQLRLEPDLVVSELTLLLEDANRMVVQEAAQALGAFGPLPDPAVTKLLNVLRTALIDCDQPMVDLLAGILLDNVPDP